MPRVEQFFDRKEIVVVYQSWYIELPVRNVSLKIVNHHPLDNTIPDLQRATLHGFIAASIEPGSTVRTDGFSAYLGLNGYVHQRHVQTAQPEDEHVLPRVHRVIGLLKRWMMGTHQGAISQEHLDDYLDEFTFRFSRRKSASRGKLFYRLMQQSVQIEPVPFAKLIKPQQVGAGGVK